MLDTLPTTVQKFMTWKWSQIAPYFQDLTARDLTAENIDQWLADWSRLTNLKREAHNRLYVAITLDTAYEAAAERLREYLVEVVEPFDSAAQVLKEKLLDSGLEPSGFAIQ